MSAEISPDTGWRYGLERVCRVLELPRSTIYAKRQARSGKGVALRPKRRGPEPKMSDARLLDAIRADLAASPFVGEGHCKPWARLRLAGIRASRTRVPRLMRENQPLSPHRRPQGKPDPHDGSITTERPDQMWGTDGIRIETVEDGWVWSFSAVDHCHAECVGWHVTKIGDRFAALEPIAHGLARHFGGVHAQAGRGLALRMAHGAYVIDGDRVVRVTDPFLKVRSVKVLRGRPWLLTGGGHVEIFADPEPPGPAFCVEHYLASPMGAPGVTNVFTSGDRDWLSTATQLFVVDGYDEHKIEGIGAVKDVRAVGGHVWAYTGPGPLYRIDASHRRAIRSDITAAGPWRTGAGQTWIRYAIANDRYGIARLSGAAIEPANLDGANVRTMADVDGTLWLATDKGAWRESRGRFVRMSDLDINAVVEVDRRAWLLGDAEVAAVDAAGLSGFPIHSGRPHRIKVIDGALWLLTQRDFNRAGPAYRIDTAGAVPHPDVETGVADVVKIGTDTRLVTRLTDGNPGPLRRVDH